MIKVRPSVFSFLKTTIFSKKKVITFSSLVIYALISYIIYLLVFSQTFISFDLTKLDNCVRCNLPVTEKLPVRSVALKYSRQYLSHRVGNILKNIFEEVLF